MSYTDAKDWIGYLEHQTPDLLGVYRANPGKGGCTIFAVLVAMSQGINLQALPWCATFVHAVINRPDVLGKAHPGTRKLARRMRRRGLWRGRDHYIPESGDLIFCTNHPDDTRRINHVAIVEDCDGKTVSSIDGNTHDTSGTFQWEQGGAVDRVFRELDDAKIVGYAATGKLLKIPRKD